MLQHALYTTLRLIGRHVSGFFGALTAFLTIGFLVGVITVLLFSLFAGVVARGLTQSLDESVLRWFEQQRGPWLNEVMLELTTLGSGSVLLILVLVASVFLWQTQHRWSVYVLLLGVVGGQILNRLLKELFERPRPSIVEGITDVSSASFPSGHAMTSLVVYGSVAYLVARLESTPRLRRSTWVLASLVILAIGVSRMYLGVHYPSDVVGGFLAGLAWLAFVASSVAAIRFFAARRPETATEEKDLQR